MTNYNIADVFTSKSFPQYTYVTRRIVGKESYELQLRQALLVDEQLIFILGAYKSGKTTLYKHVIPASKLIQINGADISNEEELWQQIAKAARIPFKSEYDNLTTELTHSTTEKSDNIILHLIEQSKILVIDDFHYIDKKLQIYIIKTLKSKLQQGLKSIIVSVLHNIDPDIQYIPFQATTIYIMPWKSKELEQIAYKGFSLLKMNISELGITMLTRESMACPHIMQENCYKLARFCSEQKIREVNDETAQRIIPYMKDIQFS